MKEFDPSDKIIGECERRKYVEPEIDEEPTITCKHCGHEFYEDEIMEDDNYDICPKCYKKL